jgi:hypothetical protein
MKLADRATAHRRVAERLSVTLLDEASVLAKSRPPTQFAWPSTSLPAAREPAPEAHEEHDGREDEHDDPIDAAREDDPIDDPEEPPPEIPEEPRDRRDVTSRLHPGAPPPTPAPAPAPAPASSAPPVTYNGSHWVPTHMAVRPASPGPSLEEIARKRREIIADGLRARKP